MKVLQFFDRTSGIQKAMPLAWLLCGSVLGILSWGDLGLFFLLPILAMGYGYARDKGTRALWIFGYFLGGSWTLVGVFNAFWPSLAPWLGMASWPIIAAVLTLPWGLIGAIGRDRPLTIGLRFFLSVIVTAIPPLGAWSLLSPLLAAGVDFPGTGIAGLIATALFLSLWAVIFAEEPHQNPHPHPLRVHIRGLNIRVTHWALAGFIAASVLTNLLYTSPSPAQHFVGLSMNWKALPSTPSFMRNLERQEHVADYVASAVQRLPEHTTVLLPEGIYGFYFKNWLSAPWTAKIQAAAASRKDIVLVGAYDMFAWDQKTSTDKPWYYLDALNAFGSVRGTYASRQPVPLGEWKPWAEGSARAYWWHTGADKIGNTPIAMAVCYSQLLVWPTASYFLGKDQPQVLLAPENHDWARTRAENRIQRRALRSWARLYSVPVVIANDLPKAHG